MLLALKYLTCYLDTMVQLIMIFLTTVAVVTSPLGLMLTILLIAMMAALNLIRVAHPPAPPYRIVLLFRQVRIRLGLSPNMSNVDDVNVPNRTMVDDHQTAATHGSILHV
ncbi:unnamed protein product [marine sediment metagenome]|uniref:Uncharacterized protein n=1 Tax=marine sediment metagenome TaxID=412755 RepID=X1KYI7_9ZZZZ